MVFNPFLHLVDFWLLGFDNIFCQLSHFRILTKFKLRFRHLNGTLMVGNHPFAKATSGSEDITPAIMSLCILFIPDINS